MDTQRENQLLNEWNEEKKILAAKVPSRLFINPREIWFTKMGQNIGFEQNGKSNFTRPVIVIKKVGNLFFTVALSTKIKPLNRFYHRLGPTLFYKKKHQERSSTIILSQVRVMDKRRFQEKIGIIEIGEFNSIKQKITELLL